MAQVIYLGGVGKEEFMKAESRSYTAIYMNTARDNLLGNGVHNHLQYGLHHKGDKVFLSRRTKLHVVLK